MKLLKTLAAVFAIVMIAAVASLATTQFVVPFSHSGIVIGGTYETDDTVETPLAGLPYSARIRGTKAIVVGADTPDSVTFVAAQTTTSTPFVSASTGRRLVRVIATECAGTPAAASFNLHNGTSDSGSRVAPNIKLAASETKVVDLGEEGVGIATGLSVPITAGTVMFTFHYRAE